ncbi:MAG: PD-(D/E)XK nuclease family protein [Polyangiaceae bacterium]|nr:PD-(D/E)XK nuclease family protein [Polyangiaceae bacterium]
MRDPPVLPSIGSFKSIPHVAASEVGRLAICPLRFVFDHDLALRRVQAYAATAMLGTAAHEAVAAMIKAQGDGRSSTNLGSTRGVARGAFDQALTLGCRRRNSVIAERGELPGDSTEEARSLPFYGMTRARLARFAEQRFGEFWLWTEPVFHERGHGPPSEKGGRLRHGVEAVEAELRLRSRDGLVVGVADCVDSRDGKVVIEELKSGEVTPERLESWRHQLLIYAQLYREQHGHIPDLLRVHSLAGGTHEFQCVPDEAADAVARARAALQDLNRRIEAGAVASELARPSEAGCNNCPHRPWCEPYWQASAPGLNAGDVEGRVASVDGWEAEVTVATGRAVRVDFSGVRVAPSAGSRLRICGSRSTEEGSLRCVSGTSVWRVNL